MSIVKTLESPIPMKCCKVFDMKASPIPQVNVFKIKNILLFSFIKKDSREMQRAIIRRLYIRSFKPTLQCTYNHYQKISPSLNFILTRGFPSKCFKLIRSLDLQLSFLQCIQQIIHRCREAKFFYINLGSFGFSSRNLTSPFTIESLKYAFNKKTEGLFLIDHWHMYESLRQTRQLVDIIKLHPIKQFSYDSEFPSNNQPHNPNSIHHRLTIAIQKKVSEMRWLEYVYLGSMHQFFLNDLQYAKMLNKFKKLKELKISNCLPVRLPFLEENIKNFSRNNCERFFFIFHNISRLRKLSLEINESSIIFFDRLCQMAPPSLTHLLICIKRPQYLTLHDSKNYNIPPGFEKSWKGIQSIKSIQDITIIHYCLTDDNKISNTILPTTCLTALQDLRSFTLETNACVRRSIIDYKELSNALASLNFLEKLRIHGHIKSKEFCDFLQGGSKYSIQIKELRLDLEFFEQVDLQTELLEWLQHKKISQLELLFGVRMGVSGECSIITPITLRNCCTAILSLKCLQYLKLAVGCPRHSFPDRSSTLRGFSTPEDMTILSNFVKDLKGIKKLVLDIGSGYLWDDELGRLISAFKDLDSLRFVAFGANFSQISYGKFEEMISEVKLLKQRPKIKDLIVRPVEYWEKNEKQLLDTLDEYYGVTEIQKCFLYLIEF